MSSTETISAIKNILLNMTSYEKDRVDAIRLHLTNDKGNIGCLEFEFLDVDGICRSSNELRKNTHVSAGEYSEYFIKFMKLVASLYWFVCRNENKKIESAIVLIKSDMTLVVEEYE